MSARGKAENQLADYKATNQASKGSSSGPVGANDGKPKEDGIVKIKGGAPIGVRDATLTVGPRGPVLLSDINLIDELSAFDRERIPERVVHAKGAGAIGHFEVTTDFLKKYTAAKLFDTVGKKTTVAIRFSTVGGESGSADTARDPRGFGVKFYTEEGNWDLVGNNTPIFFIRDPILFPSFIHTQKRNPVTHLKDADMVWDFFTLRPETTHQTLFLFSDRGIPDGYRFMNGYGSHTYKLINDKQEAVYVKWHFKCDQGIKNLDAKKADDLAGSDPDYSIRDLHNAIANKDYPSWTLKVQIMTYEQAEKFRWNPFDLTKIWPQKEYPLHEVGRMTLTKNPNNYFAEVEQIALSPSNLVPGIEASPDKMLQARLFAYADTQRHRLGANHLQLPINCPYRVKIENYQRDGPMCFSDNQGGAPNYYPNSFGGPVESKRVATLIAGPKGDVVEGNINRYRTGEDNNFEQATTFYEKVLNADEQKRLIDNMAGNLANASEFLHERAIKMFANVSSDLSNRLRDTLKSKLTAKF